MKQRFLLASSLMVLAALFFGTGSEGVSQAGKLDPASIDGIVGSIYDSITFSKGTLPNLKQYRTLFIPNASFTRLRANGVDQMDLEGFISSFFMRIRNGEITQFHESEIARKTLQYGRMAQVFSTYKKTFTPGNPASFTRGINSMQFFYDGQRWWITSICWQDESGENPIPKKYLK
jgi:hypothetical protein